MGLAVRTDIAVGNTPARMPGAAAEVSSPMQARVRKSEGAAGVRANVEQVLLSEDPFRAVGVREIASSRQAKGQANAASEFEAFILQSFIQEMLPKDAESVFGKGTAGSVWRSMLSEKIANEVARSGGIGIAERLGQAIDERARALPTNPDAANASQLDERQ